MPIRHFVHEHVHVALKNYGYGHYRKLADYSPSVDDHGPCLTSFSGGGRVVRRCHVSCVTGASN